MCSLNQLWRDFRNWWRIRCAWRELCDPCGIAMLIFIALIIASLHYLISTMVHPIIWIWIAYGFLGVVLLIFLWLACKCRILFPYLTRLRTVDERTHDVAWEEGQEDIPNPDFIDQIPAPVAGFREVRIDMQNQSVSYAKPDFDVCEVYEQPPQTDCAPRYQDHTDRRRSSLPRERRNRATKDRNDGIRPSASERENLFSTNYGASTSKSSQGDYELVHTPPKKSQPRYTKKRSQEISEKVKRSDSSSEKAEKIDLDKIPEKTADNASSDERSPWKTRSKDSNPLRMQEGSPSNSSPGYARGSQSDLRSISPENSIAEKDPLLVVKRKTTNKEIQKYKSSVPGKGMKKDEDSSGDKESLTIYVRSLRNTPSRQASNTSPAQGSGTSSCDPLSTSRAKEEKKIAEQKISESCRPKRQTYVASKQSPSTSVVPKLSLLHTSQSTTKNAERSQPGRKKITSKADESLSTRRQMAYKGLLLKIPKPEQSSESDKSD